MYVLLMCRFTVNQHQGTFIWVYWFQFCFCLPLNRSNSLNNCSPWSSFFSRPSCGRALSCSEANRKSQKLYPFVNMAEKHGAVPTQFNQHIHVPCGVQLYIKPGRIVQLVACLIQKVEVPGSTPNLATNFVEIDFSPSAD